VYQRPYTIEEIEKLYTDKASMLKNDPIHLWRAKTGIELIHKEPILDEQERIWNNWNEMTDEMKSVSDTKSKEIFGIDNTAHHAEIMKEWGKEKV